MVRRLRFGWILALLLTACAAPYGPDDLTGTWVGNDNAGQMMTVSFSPGGAINMTFVNSLGEASTIDGQFEVDFSKQPIPLSIRKIPQLPNSLHTIIEFQGRDLLRIGGLAPRWRLRPITFDAESSVTLLREQSPD